MLSGSAAPGYPSSAANRAIPRHHPEKTVFTPPK